MAATVRRDLRVTLNAEPGLAVTAHDLSGGTPLDLVTVALGQLDLNGTLDEVEDVLARAATRVYALRVARMLAPEQARLDPLVAP
jgi:hypothetical protein